MTEPFAANAVLAKTLAKYGKRITNRQFKELTALPGVTEIAAYLRANTRFADVLERLPKSGVHRGNLESLLRQKVFTEFDELCRFESSVGEHFFDYILTRIEIEEILRYLRLLSAGNPESYLFVLPTFSGRHIRIDPKTLSEAADFDAFLRVVKDTPYYDLLLPAKTESGFDIGLAGSALNRYRYRRLFEILRARFPGKSGERLRELFAVRIDFENLRRILRGKRYFDDPPDVIAADMIPGGRHFKGERLRALIEAPGEAEVLKRLAETRRYGSLLRADGADDIDRAADKAVFGVCKKMLRYSGSAAAAMAAYMMLTEAELEDLVTVIEGVRYKVPPDEIAKLLVVYEGSE